MSLPDTAIPVIPRGVRIHFDKVRDTWVLLAPERTITLDAIGHAILSELDGVQDFGSIVGALAAKFDAPRDAINADAGEFVMGLAERRFVDIRP